MSLESNNPSTLEVAFALFLEESKKLELQQADLQTKIDLKHLNLNITRWRVY